MLNKDNYVPWSSRLLRYAKSKPNGKLIYNFIMHGPYVRRMIPEPGDPDREVPVAETFHEQTDDKLTKKNCKTAQEIWLRVQQMMKGSNIGVQEKRLSCLMNEKCLLPLMENRLSLTIIVEENKLRAERLARTHDPLAPMANSNNPFNYLMVGGNDGNQFRQYAGENVRNQNGYYAVQNVENQVAQNAVQNLGVQNVGSQNGLIVVMGIANQNVNQNGNGNVVAARAEGNGNRNNENQVRCYNCRGMGHLARNCTVRPRRMDVAYLQTQLLIAQKEEIGIQLQAKEFDLMAVAGDLDEIKEVNANYILMAKLQQASTSGTETDKAPVYDSDGLAEKSNDSSSCVYDPEETLQLAQESRLKMKQLNKEIKQANYAKINQLSEVFVSQKAKSREELYFSNASKTASVSISVSKSISISNEEFSDDTFLGVARKFLNEVSEQKDTTQGTSANTKFTKQSILGKPPSSSKSKLYSVTPFPNSKVIPKVGETNALLKLVTSNSAPSTRESKVVKNDNVISPGMFRINPSKTSRVENVMPNDPFLFNTY
ncbi:retrovirus-related pol polyprotein from transposon TNT 1-94 [Tanacetum coccineum]